MCALEPSPVSACGADCEGNPAGDGDGGGDGEERLWSCDEEEVRVVGCDQSGGWSGLVTSWGGDDCYFDYIAIMVRVLVIELVDALNVVVGLSYCAVAHTRGLQRPARGNG